MRALESYCRFYSGDEGTAESRNNFRGTCGRRLALSPKTPKRKNPAGAELRLCSLNRTCWCALPVLMCFSSYVLWDSKLPHLPWGRQPQRLTAGSVRLIATVDRIFLCVGGCRAAAAPHISGIARRTSCAARLKHTRHTCILGRWGTPSLLSPAPLGASAPEKE